jgi:hypothetical protein
MDYDTKEEHWAPDALQCDFELRVFFRCDVQERDVDGSVLSCERPKDADEDSEPETLLGYVT